MEQSLKDFVRQMASTCKNHIYVYNGEGASPENIPVLMKALEKHLSDKYQVSCITPEETKKGTWQDTASAYVIGGGYDLGFINALGDEGTGKIRNYVKSGGTYLGICAGSYFACEQIMFDKGGHQEVCGHRQLKFYPGICIGPVYGPYNYHVKIGARAAPIEFVVSESSQPIRFNGYYLGGGMFVPYKVKDYIICKIPDNCQLTFSDVDNETLRENLKQRHRLGLVKQVCDVMLTELEENNGRCEITRANNEQLREVMKTEIVLRGNFKGDNSVEDMGTEVEVLSSYCGLQGNPAAAVKCKVGEGTAVLCAMHIECDSESLNKEDRFLQPIANALTKDDDKQRLAFSSMLQHLGLEVRC